MNSHQRNEQLDEAFWILAEQNRKLQEENELLKSKSNH